MEACKLTDLANKGELVIYHMSLLPSIHTVQSGRVGPMVVAQHSVEIRCIYPQGSQHIALRTAGRHLDSDYVVEFL